MISGIITKVAGPLVIAEGMRDANMFDVVRVSSQRLIGEIIEMHGDRASIQVYEETSGLGPGETVESTGVPLSVELGPGLIGSIYDGIQRPLNEIMKVAGSNLTRGVEVPSLDHSKKWHFCPTENNKANLLKEGVPEKDIYVTGNTVIDALLMAKDMVANNPPEIGGLPKDLMSSNERMVLITGHRRENFGEGFEHICTGVRNLAERFTSTHFVYPVHLNPNVREPVGRILGHHCGKNVHLIEPQSYLPFVALMNRAYLILTDSGGVQEEAPSLGKPVLVMRDTTERPEAVTAGTVKIVGTACETIEAETIRLLTDETEYSKMKMALNPYGDGDAVSRIVSQLEKA